MFICGGALLPEGIPDLSSDEDPCCAGRALEGPRGCECWVEVFRPAGQAEVAEGLPQVPAPVEMCHDCAYRGDSPEKRGEAGYAGNAELLERLAAEGEPFYCHQGIRLRIGWVHPASGRWFAPPKGDYCPPIRGAVPYRADGSPAVLCSGWLLRAATLRRQREVP